jgi:hypothetical protein
MLDNVYEAYAKEMLERGVASDDPEYAFGALLDLFEFYGEDGNRRKLLLDALSETDWLDPKMIRSRTPRQRAYDRETRRLRFLVEVAKADGVRAPLQKVAEQQGIRVKSLEQRLWRYRRDLT